MMDTMHIETVTIAGVGLVGGQILEHLRDAGFKISILTRSAAQSQFPNTTVHVVDYENVHGLTLALAGQDAVVSTIGLSGTLAQKKLIDAAVAAGVKHFIPSAYTVDTFHPIAREIPLYNDILQIQDYLGTKIRWTTIHVGALLEYLFHTPFLLDFEACHAILWDGGSGTLTVSDTATVAQTVVGVLKNVDNVGQVVKVRGGTITQNQALEIAKQYATWTSEVRNAQLEIEEDKRILASGGFDLGIIMRWFAAATYTTDNDFGLYKKCDNSWLGVKDFDSQRVAQAIEARMQGVAHTRSLETMGDLQGILTGNTERQGLRDD